MVGETLNDALPVLGLALILRKLLTSRVTPTSLVGRALACDVCLSFHATWLLHATSYLPWEIDGLAWTWRGGLVAGLGTVALSAMMLRAYTRLDPGPSAAELESILQTDPPMPAAPPPFNIDKDTHPDMVTRVTDPTRPPPWSALR